MTKDLFVAETRVEYPQVRVQMPGQINGREGPRTDSFLEIDAKVAHQKAFAKREGELGCGIDRRLGEKSNDDDDFDWTFYLEILQTVTCNVMDNYQVVEALPTRILNCHFNSRYGCFYVELKNSILNIEHKDHNLDSAIKVTVIIVMKSDTIRWIALFIT